ncbi:MAG: sulfatase [Pseudomonadota bacterium]|nr:sulfatase [Pseudomonadota bacterium]
MGTRSWRRRPIAPLLALGLGLACSGGTEAPAAAVPVPQDLPALGLTDAAGTLAWRGLDVLDTARIVLPPPAADAPTVTGAFPLGGEWADTGRMFGRLRIYAYALPFVTDMPRPNYAPMGARLYRGDTELPFVNDPEDLRGGGWFVEDGNIQLFTLEHPSRWSTAPRLQVDELAAEAKRRRWSGVGSAEAWVRTEVTIAGVTRRGVQLPPGAELTFTVDVPADPTLEFGLAMLPALLPDDEGGRASVSWLVDGEEVDSAAVVAGAAPTDRRLSLAKWAGRKVDLTFRAAADAVGNAVVTSPTITTRTGRVPRHVVVVGIDTLRHDALGLYGYDRPTSPELDAWAAQSVVFDAAWAPAPRTRPSFRTALTGRYPLAAAAAPTMAESFSAEGFRTAGVVANVHLVPRFGFSDGFEHWHYENGAKAEVEVDRALAWQKAHADEDTFLFLHLMDPHTYYDAPAPYGAQFHTGPRPDKMPETFERWQVYRILEEPWFGDDHKRWIREAYDGEVAYTSAMLGRFFAELDKLPGRTLTAVHSDHGEEMFEHGGFEHNHTLYDELVRVALWIRPPGGRSGATRIAEPVGLIDLAPTLLDLVGLPAVPSDGRSLAAFVDPVRSAEAPALKTELAARPLMLGHLMFGKERWGVVSGGWKYLLHTGSGQEEVYDLGADPHEQKDLIAETPAERLDALRAAMETASGWAVRPGWRLRVEGPRRPLDLRFDAPIADAGIIDPEAERSSRSNLEWGERPQIAVAEVGRIVVSEDRRSVRFVPGPRASGHRIQVSCLGPCPAGTVSVGESVTPLLEGSLAVAELRLEATPGTILDVPDADEQLAAPESTQMQALQALGYIDPD